jgi:hypothetical protein
MEEHPNIPPTRKYLHIVVFTRAMLMAFEGGCPKTVGKRYTILLAEAGLKPNDHLTKYHFSRLKNLPLEDIEDFIEKFMEVRKT